MEKDGKPLMLWEIKVHVPLVTWMISAANAMEQAFLIDKTSLPRMAAIQAMLSKSAIPAIAIKGGAMTATA
jgi:hypothetical protein